jgi:hypothetical protein
MRNCFLIAFMPFVLLALGAAAPDSVPRGWQQVQGLGPHTRIHIKSDKENAICFVHSVDEQQLTCARSEAIGSPVLVFPREQIKSIKLSRRPLSAEATKNLKDSFWANSRIFCSCESSLAKTYHRHPAMIHQQVKP